MPGRTTPRIRCLGGVTIDRKLKSWKPLRRGTSNPVTSLSTFGGVAHNVALNLRQLTSNISLQSAVGNDDDGYRILAHVREHRIAADDILILAQQRTAHYDAILDEEGELYLALADMAIFDSIPCRSFIQAWDAWAEHDLVFLDTNLPEAILEQAINTARVKKIRLAVDPVSVSKAQKLPHSLEGVLFIKPDRLEAEALSGVSIQSTADCFKAGKILLNRGVQHVIISLGKDGYVVVNAAMQKQVPAKIVHALVDVSGAGDAFVAGMLYSIKQGGDILDACQMGENAAIRALYSYQNVALTPIDSVQEQCVF